MLSPFWLSFPKGICVCPGTCDCIRPPFLVVIPKMDLRQPFAVTCRRVQRKPQGTLLAMRSHPSKPLPRPAACLISAAALALWLCTPAATAQTSQNTPSTPAKRPMTFADLQAIKRIADPQISPSGKWVMFSVTDVSLEKNTKTNHLWVVPLNAEKTQNPERQLTFGNGETNGRFSPDGKQILFTSSKSKEEGSQIWLAAWDEAGGTLGPWRRLTGVSTEADGGLWSPDSQRILFTSSVYPSCSDKPTFAEEDACNKARDAAAEASPVKAQIFDHLLFRHWNQYTGEKRSHILVVDVAGSTQTGVQDGTHIRDLTPRSVVGDAETPTFSLGGPLGYAWSPDSHEIAYSTDLDPVPAASTNNDVFTLQLDNPNAKATKISTSPGSDDGPQYSPDGKYLAFRSQAKAGSESDRFRLMLYNRGTKHMVELMPTFDGWVEEFSWMPDSHHLVFVSARQGEAPYGIVSVTEHSPGFYEFRTRIDKLGGFSEVHILSNLAVVAARMRVDRPSEIVVIPAQVYDSAGNPLREQPDLILTHQNDQTISSLELAKLEPFRFPGADNTPVQGFLLRPPNFDPTRKYPLKFLIHGGPQGAWGDAWSFRWNPELFAASGYVVVMINPRGSTGYGQKFIDEINGDWGGKPYIDLMRGLDYAEQHFPFIDKTRECALGASYGGFMANWILTHPDSQHPDRFACIVTHDGMFNPAAAYGTTEELWFNEWEFRRPGASEPGQPWRYATGPVADDPFRKWSPMLSIQNAKTPTLVIHGQRDFRLDVSEGLQLFTALQRLGVPSEMLYFPDEGHWVLKPQNSELWYKTVEDWCDRWTHTNRYAHPAAATAQAGAKP